MCWSKPKGSHIVGRSSRPLTLRAASACVLSMAGFTQATCEDRRLSYVLRSRMVDQTCLSHPRDVVTCDACAPTLSAFISVVVGGPVDHPSSALLLATADKRAAIGETASNMVVSLCYEKLVADNCFSKASQVAIRTALRFTRNAERRRRQMRSEQVSTLAAARASALVKAVNAARPGHATPLQA